MVDFCMLAVMSLKVGFIRIVNHCKYILIIRAKISYNLIILRLGKVLLVIVHLYRCAV
jgi:hypothetical protein